MTVVRSRPSIEAWLTRSAESWALLSDAEYRAVVERWRQAFAGAIDGPFAVQGVTAVAEFEAQLPATVILFNGVSVPRAAVVTGARHPHAYKAVRLQSVERELAHGLDLVLVNDAFAYCCVCTHEWQGVAHPIFSHAAAWQAIAADRDQSALDSAT